MQVKNQINSLEDLQSAICSDFPNISVCIKQFDCSSDTNKANARRNVGIECAKAAISKLSSNNFIDHNEFGAPIFPDGLIGSISHSSNLAISVCCAPSDKLKTIGVDLETNFAKSSKVLSKIATSHEIANLPFEGFSLEESAASIFCIKEAFYKAVNILAGSDGNRMTPTWSNLTVLGVSGTQVKAEFNLKNNPDLKFNVNLYRCLFSTPFVCSIVTCE